LTEVLGGGIVTTTCFQTGKWQYQECSETLHPAATQGQGDDYLTILEMFKEGFVSKDDLPLLFVHTRPLSMQPKVHRGR